MSSNIRYLPLLLLLTEITSCTYTFFPATCAYPIPGKLTRMNYISDTLVETSGLQIKDDAFVSFNDSGGDPVLYVFNNKGNIIYKTIIGEISNADWESIAYDGSNYYVGDVGNNFGSRDTLTIYKIPISEIASNNFLSNSQRITFSYDEQASMTNKGWYSHDCEAMFYYRDSLYLFAKDWVSMNTRIYVLPVIPGHYKIHSRISYPVNALITGADINGSRKEVVMVGYKRSLMPVIIKYSFIEDPAMINCGGKARKYPKLTGTQMEGISLDDDGRIYISSEKRIYKQALYQSY